MERHGAFRVTVRRDMPVDFPFAKSAAHPLSAGLDDAAKQAMVKHVRRRCQAVAQQGLQGRC